jgi:hypothetical protein
MKMKSEASWILVREVGKVDVDMRRSNKSRLEKMKYTKHSSKSLCDNVTSLYVIELHGDCSIFSEIAVV